MARARLECVSPESAAKVAAEADIPGAGQRARAEGSTVVLDYVDAVNRLGDYLTVQKVGKLTPHETRRQAEAERDDLRAEVERLRKQVAALQGDGDRIGFCVVTYNQVSGQPGFSHPDLHQYLDDAVTERDCMAEETARYGRGETHAVAEVVQLPDGSGEKTIVQGR